MRENFPLLVFHIFGSDLSSVSKLFVIISFIIVFIAAINQLPTYLQRFLAFLKVHLLHELSNDEVFEFACLHQAASLLMWSLLY